MEECKRHLYLEEKVNTMHKEMFGNGDSSKSLITRMLNLENCMNNIAKQLRINNIGTWFIAAGVISAVIKLMFFAGA